MLYSEFVEVYEKIAATTKRLEKVAIVSEFLGRLRKKGKSEWFYLLMGKVFPGYDTREFGISRQLVTKAIAKAYGVDDEKVVERFNKIGDFGEIAKELAGKRRQSVLFSSKLETDKVFDNLRKLVTMEGKGAVEKKMVCVAELLNSASGDEAKYIVRTVLSDLRIGMAEGVLRDALASAFFPDDPDMKMRIEEAYDLVNDYSVVFDAAAKGKEELAKIGIIPGRPLNVMLPVKVEKMEEAFEITGKPAALEHKYDGFRMIISKEKNGKINLFTRKLENVTNQFPDVVEVVKKYIKGESFILDSEAVGFDRKTGKYKPFEAISQRIKRKYDIEKLINLLPVEVNVFDVLYYNGKSVINEPFRERRKLVEKIVKTEDMKIKPSIQIVTDDDKEAEKFYQGVLKMGEEGIMVKKLDAPYKQGRRVGYMVKLKPIINDLDLVIVGAEYGTGKRAGWLTSYIVACRDNNNFLEVGMVSSGLKEISEADGGDEGTTYDEMTKLLKPLIIGTEGTRVIVKPKVVVSVTYQNIQESPSYSSGYAMRFPRISHYRPDRQSGDIATLEDIKKAAQTGR